MLQLTKNWTVVSMVDNVVIEYYMQYHIAGPPTTGGPGGPGPPHFFPNNAFMEFI